MGLSSLNAALSGLRISQQQINVISNNIANVGTPGYSRKILPQSAQSIAGVTIGVLPETIIRNVSLNVRRDLWTQVSASSALGTKSTYLSRVEEFHGPPDRELSVAAQLGRLRDSFAALADSPEDNFLRTTLINQAMDTANKINSLSNFITNLRNDAQSEMQATVTRINDLLGLIANLNDEVRAAMASDRTSALLEDQRDDAVQELSGLIGITFFTRGDGVLVVQTTEGVELASDRAVTLVFRPTPVSAITGYPDSAEGVYIGDPLTNALTAIDITARDPGGKLGGLIELRDETFPKQMAQLDEMAHKLALRLEAQGLRLFTNGAGIVPPDDPPDPSAIPPVAVAYVGFSGEIRVNEAIRSNPNLLQQGTYGATLPQGSNEVIRRALQFGFGNIIHQEAIGDIDLRVSTFVAPNNTLQAFLGLHSTNQVTGARDLSSFLSAADLIASANGSLNPTNDTVRFTFSDPDLGLGPLNLDVALSLVPDGAGNFNQDLIDYITTVVIPALPAADQTALATMNVQFSQTANGELRITSRGDIAIDATNPANPMLQEGLDFLGLIELTSEATDPYFDVQVGNAAPVRIYIDPNDTEVELMAKLNAVPGLAVEDITLGADGFLRIRPGNDYSNPDFGGDIRLVAGPAQTSAAGANAVFGAGTIPDGLNIVSALFGSFTGTPPRNASPITDVEYLSETAVGSGVFVSFREEYLGPGVDIATNVVGSKRLLDFGQKMINQHAQELALTNDRKADEESLRDTLEQKLRDDSGVNLDEELGHLISVQTAYAASARVITAVSELFQELLNAVR